MDAQPATTATVEVVQRAPDIVPLARVLVLAVALLLLTRNVTARFTGHHEWNSAMYAHFARNHLVYGLGYTKLYCTWGDSQEPPAEPQRYLNHPPLIAAWVAVPMWVFGDEEWVARSVPIAASVGTAWVLMVMLGRLQSPACGLLAGLFYAVMPMTAYFGRMLDHVALVGFFNMLMLHGYLQRTGMYGQLYRRRVGALWYLVACVAGIGTGWGAIIMAGVIWVWHFVRVIDGRQNRAALVWLALVPGSSLAAVAIHILWAAHWDVSLFGPLLWTRTLGQDSAAPITWSKWCVRQWEFLRGNVTVIGAGGAAFYLVGMPLARLAGAESRLRRAMPGRSVWGVSAAMAIYGLIYLLLFRNRSWAHDYWQFSLAPFVAVALASMVAWVGGWLGSWSRQAGVIGMTVLVLLPIPGFARGLDAFHSKPRFLPRQVEVLAELRQRIPPRVPAMTSWHVPEFTESFGGYTNRWTFPQIAYYADRPLIYSEDLNEILTNEKRCAAYVWEITDDPERSAVAEELANRYETVRVGTHHLIVLLDHPR